MLEELLTLRAESDFLSQLGEEDLAYLAGELEESRCSRGEVLLRAGEPGDRAYLVLEGRLAVVVEPVEGFQGATHEAGPGSVVGDLVLLVGGVRTSTVRALEDCRLAGLSRAAFGRLLERNSRSGRRVAELVATRLRRARLSPQLEELFGPFDQRALARLHDDLEWLELASGKTLFHQGDPGDAAYVLTTGRLRAATVDAEGRERPLSEIASGELVGEMALLTGQPRSMTVYAVRDSELARLSREGFQRLIETRPSAAMGTARLIADRLTRRDATAPAAQTASSSIALIAAGRTVPLAQFARQLGDALAAYGPVALLDSDRVDRELRKEGIAHVREAEVENVRLVQWLDEREAASRFVLYRADADASNWSQRCVRLADHVITVADAHEAPEPGEAEQRLAAGLRGPRSPRWSLVLLQGGREPEGTDRWLADRSVDQHYHLARDSREDLDRLARMLTGSAVGLVLGGGGARGFAHIGVLRALHELGIPIDLVGGTSIGAVIAGIYGLSRDWRKALEISGWAFKSMLDFTVPAVSLASGRRLAANSRSIFGDRRIEDLWLPYFAMSTNLTRGEQVVHRRGDVVTAIRATTALPGIFPPVTQDGDLLIDGGMLNNVPVDVMRRHGGGGPVIAVDVSPSVDLEASPKFTGDVSGWRLLWSRLNPLAETIPAPGILSLLLRATVVGSVATSNRTRLLAELYLDLPVDEWGLLEFEAVSEVVERGYEAAVERLRSWRDDTLRAARGGGSADT